MRRPKAYPLHLLSDQPERRLHSQLDATPYSRAGKVAGREPVYLSRGDAAARVIADDRLGRAPVDGTPPFRPSARHSGLASLPGLSWFRARKMRLEPSWSRSPTHIEDPAMGAGNLPAKAGGTPVSMQLSKDRAQIE